MGEDSKNGLAAELRRSGGRPAIFIDGEQIPPILYGLSDIPASRCWTGQARRNIRNFAEAGIAMVQIDLCLRDCWREDGGLDLSIASKELQSVIEVSPEAVVFIRLHMNPPHWWMKANPDELVVYADGPAEDQGEAERLISRDGERMMRVSLASEKWLEEAGGKLADFCRTLAAKPEGARVAGIQVACGIYGEWHYWGFGSEPDYGKAMTGRFRRFLKAKYGSDEALRAAWGRPSASIETAEIAGLEERYAAADPPFRDPKAGRAAIDALKCHQGSVADAIIRFCEIAKLNWPRPLLAGCFYGYFFHVGPRAALGGHLETGRVLASPHVDYLSGPHSYDPRNRELGGAGYARGLLESVRLHGKLWLTEMDEHPIGTETHVGGDPAKHPETIAKMRRSMLDPALRGMGAWFYDHRIVPTGDIYKKEGWWDHPALMEEVRKERAFYGRLARKPFVPAADTALVFDTEVYYHVKPTHESNPVLRYVNDSLLVAASHSGAAFDCVYAHDLRRVDWSRYKCVVFANCFVVDAARRDFIKKRVAKDGRHLLWIYAAGYSDDERLDVSLIGGLTGIEVERTAPKKAFYSSGCGLPERSCEAETAPSPLFAIADADAEKAAFFSGSKDCAGARRIFPGHTSWYFSLPPDSPDILREIFRQAGAHIYSEAGDAICAGSGLLMIHTAKGGHRTLNFKGGRERVVELPPASTSLFDLEGGEELRL